MGTCDFASVLKKDVKCVELNFLSSQSNCTFGKLVCTCECNNQFHVGKKVVPVSKKGVPR